MGKIKTKWICENCGYESFSYLGKCPECNEFATFVEQIIEKESKFIKSDKEKMPITSINEVEIDEKCRILTDYEELDRVLGGGFVQGSLTLFTGDPGIGKSTLILQASKNIANKNKKILYICAEESTHQVKLRANRLNVNSENLFVTSENSVEGIVNAIETLKPDFLIVDSIQAVYLEKLSSSIGSISQIRECANVFMHIAKQKNITTILIGHVTKEGNIAGPKILEHMVDSVINFEGDRYKTGRLLRSVKNRFGATSEIGVFDMQETGLVEVKNPSELFLRNKNDINTSGTVIVATSEGTRILLLEIQALVGSTPYQTPRRVARGFEYNRLLQILAVLEKRVGLNLSKADVYVNITGGIDVIEPALDLAVALAILTCANDIVLDNETVVVGEIGLNSEIRYVPNLEMRIKEAKKLGFKRMIVPKANNIKEKFKKDNIEIIEVSKIMDAIKNIRVQNGQKSDN